MKNPEFKEIFLNYLTPGNRKSRSADMKAFGDYEDKIGKDLFEMSTEELQGFLSERSMRRHMTLAGYCSTLKLYFRYCEECNIQVECDFDRLSAMDHTKYHLVVFRDPADLSKTMDEIMGVSGESTLRSVYKTVFWLAFMGLTMHDALDLSVSDVNLKDKYVWCHQTTFTIPDEAIQDFDIAANSNGVMRVSDCKDKQVYAVMQRAKSDKLIRNSSSPSMPKSSIRSFVNMCRNGCEKQLKFDCVRISGIFFRAHIFEKSGVPFDFAGYALKEAPILGKSFSNYAMQRQYVRITSHEYELDYIRWKRALGIRDSFAEFDDVII